jgi:hypothetical protein
MPGLNLPPTPFDVEKTLRRVVDKIILPKFPEVVTYVITPGEVGNMSGKVIVYYNLYYGINTDVLYERARELFEDSYSLFNMLGFDNARLNVSTKRVMDGMSI